MLREFVAAADLAAARRAQGGARARLAMMLTADGAMPPSSATTASSIT